jgi:glutamine synthetase
MKSAGASSDIASLKQVTDLVSQLERCINELQHAIDHKHAPGSDTLSHAKHFRDEVIPVMLEVRKVSDQLESLIADDLWPLPTYREMLFIR